LPIYVDLDYYRNTSPKFNLHQRYPQFKFIALMVSRLTKEKDFPFALSVFSQVVKEYPKAGLIIVGDGPERHKIEQRAKQLDLYNHVILEGWQGDLVSYYKTANLFLHTSRYEGFGMVLVEAAACGLPIVTSEVGVAVPMKKQERSGVFVCPVGDQDCFVQEVLAFLKDNTRRMLVKFNLENDLRSVTLGSREEYLEAYRQSFESCGRT
jgi:glycosyltransferase involved in cell wall biosynthesis